MLVEHLESYLGEVDGGGTLGERLYKINSAYFPDGPIENGAVTATIGMSHAELKMKDRSLRQELLLAMDKGVPEQMVSTFLLSFAEYVVGRREALVKGEVVGPYKAIFNGSAMNAVYVTSPWYVEENIDLETDKGEIIMVALLPIYAEEAEWIAENGWEQFETLLEQEETDLYVPDRPIFAFVAGA